MCGIAGELRLDGAPAAPHLVARMVAAMRHRGPDGDGAWSDREIALGHARLAVRELGPAGAQPMLAPGGAGALVYNGEVYNDRALRPLLEDEGVRFAGTGDAEVVLHALARWGPRRAVRELEGMFAFAWWDARTRELWLGRDRFGIKPLQTSTSGSRFLFASEFRGLRAIDGVGAQPDALWIASYLVSSRASSERAPYAGIECVPPGGLWRVAGGRVERGTWFDLVEAVDPDRIVESAREAPRAWTLRLGAALEADVSEHLVSDVPVATFLSGGVDSGLVTALAARGRRGLPAYTVDTCAPDSEIGNATLTARHVGAELRPVRVDRATHLRVWPEAVRAVETPTLHASTPEAYLMARQARADGVVVALTGEGSDELLGGYDFFGHTWRRWRAVGSAWRRRFSKSARRWGPRELAETPFAYQPARREPELHLRIAASVLPEDVRAWALMQRLTPVEPPEDRAFLAHGFDSLRRHLGSILVYHDRIGMAASIEARVPFLGRRVAHVAFGLPRAAKWRGDRDKWALREVAAAHLPAEIAFGEKRGFPIPASHDAGVASFLRAGAVADLLGWSASAQDALVPRIEADVRLRRQLAGLEMWLRLFFRDEPADSVSEALGRAVA